MYYLITVYNDKGFTEVLTMKSIDIQLINLYRHCIDSYNNKNMLINGMLLEWQDKKNELIFVEIDDLIGKFKFLEATNLADDYEELKQYIFHNYKKGEKVSV